MRSLQRNSIKSMFTVIYKLINTESPNICNNKFKLIVSAKLLFLPKIPYIFSFLNRTHNYTSTTLYSTPTLLVKSNASALIFEFFQFLFALPFTSPLAFYFLLFHFFFCFYSFLVFFRCNFIWYH